MKDKLSLEILIEKLDWWRKIAHIGGGCKDRDICEQAYEQIKTMIVGENDKAKKKGEKGEKEMKGLYQKYVVSKTSGKPIDPKAQFIILRIDDGRYLHACRAGVAAFAEAVREHNPILADDIQKILRKIKEESADEK